MAYKLSEHCDQSRLSVQANINNGVDKAGELILGALTVPMTRLNLLTAISPPIGHPKYVWWDMAWHFFDVALDELTRLGEVERLPDGTFRLVRQTSLTAS